VSALAYVFWHRPVAGAQGYEDGLTALHASLAAAPPEGFIASGTFHVDDLPWLGAGGPGYEDWYLVRDWAALGILNTAAVAPPHGEAHDPVAALAAEGAGGVYRGRPALPPGGPAWWLAKPAGWSYPAVHEALAPAGEVWQRQMVLGPAPEFCVTGAPEHPARRVERRMLDRPWVSSTS